MTDESLEFTDMQLIARVLAGEGGAFGALARRHVDPVYSALRWRGIKDEDAVEMTRETMLRSYHELGAVREPGRLGQLLQQVAGTEALNFSRRRRPTTSYDRNVLDPLTNPVKHAEAVMRSAAWLPEDCRHTFFLKHRTGLGCASIARTTGVTVGDIVAQLNRCHELLSPVLRQPSEPDGCTEWREALLIVATGEAPAAALARHLQDCDDCPRRLEHFRTLFQHLTEISGGESMLMETLADEIGAVADALPPPKSESQWPARLLWLAIGATTITLALAVWGVLNASE